jgi:hypothetical protein
MLTSGTLQANDLNSNKAINAYFEDPTPPELEVTLEDD